MREKDIIENLQREDLNPIETANAIKQLMEEYKYTQEEVADRIGKSRPAIANTLRLLTLREKGNWFGPQSLRQCWLLVRRCVRRSISMAAEDWWRNSG